MTWTASKAKQVISNVRRKDISPEFQDVVSFSKDDDDNLCPVCEDSCTCGALAVMETSEEKDTTETDSEPDYSRRRSPHTSPLKKRILLSVDYDSSSSSDYIDDSSSLCSDDVASYLLSDSDNDFEFPEKTDLFAALEDLPTDSFSVPRMSIVQMPFLQSPARSSVTVEKPATYLSIYSNYYESDEDEDLDSSNFDDTAIQIEDILVESVIPKDEKPQNENDKSLEYMDSLSKVPIGAFRRTRKLSVPFLEFSYAVRDLPSHSSIHNTLLPEQPQATSHWTVSEENPQMEYSFDIRIPENPSSPIWLNENEDFNALMSSET